MSHANSLIAFLRHYGPISASGNMYDESIQSEIEHHKISRAIDIKQERLGEVKENFASPSPRNIILTGTAGDGKTYYCRRVWTHFGGAHEEWREGKKVVSLALLASGKSLTIVKDLSELKPDEKDDLLAKLTKAVSDKNNADVFLVAANDGQLLASWRDWSDSQDEDQRASARRVFKTVEDMLVEELERDNDLNLCLYNLSRLDAARHFQELVEQIVEHPQWSQCQGCELLKNDTTTCPIRINRERLRGGIKGSIFLRRLCELMKLSLANRMRLPIRDLLLLCVNILLGDRQGQRILLTCRTAKERAEKHNYHLTNPYANTFGVNLPARQRQQYQIFTTLEAFGIGRETDNKFDDLIIYGAYGNTKLYKELAPKDEYYGLNAYKEYLRDYLEGERENINEFMRALSRERQRLFFSLSPDSSLDPWRLTVYRESGRFLEFVEALANDNYVYRTVELLVRGLNRTLCGMMIDDGKQLYLASSGGDGRGRFASLLNYALPTTRHRRHPYLRFSLGSDHSNPRLQIMDPRPTGAESDKVEVVDSLNLQLTHFEYLIRVANGSLPASFSRQCNEDFLDFKLRLIKRLGELIGKVPSRDMINLKVLTVDELGRVHSEEVDIPTGLARG